MSEIAISMQERIRLFYGLFDKLTSTNSRNEKENTLYIFKQHYPTLTDDLDAIFETLANQHPIGWTFTPRGDTPILDIRTIREAISILEQQKDHTYLAVMQTEAQFGVIGEFIAPIVNRTLRLGIGKSQLPVSIITPMLAKKYNGQMLHNDKAVTEKLDGNRCIARYNTASQKWEFTSRTGKPLRVTFDMSHLPIEFKYDGEIMSIEQTALSIRRANAIVTDDELDISPDAVLIQQMFNKTSGLINNARIISQGLVYNIFDIISDFKYYERRKILSTIGRDLPENINVRILPLLYIGDDNDMVTTLLYKIVGSGGEGVMLNDLNAKYEHKRTDALLKYKQVQYLDMRVVGATEGKGKYEGQIGALQCYMCTEDGKEIYCDVGSGLSDTQRDELISEGIVGKIVQVAYHEITANKNSDGNTYSLRFPRLIKIRDDKEETSEY